MAPHGPVTVLLARFEDLVAAGLRSLIDADPSLEIVAGDVTADRLSTVIGETSPQVAILNLVALLEPGDVNRLHRAHPSTQLVVLAHSPSPAECSQLLALGAAACLGRDVQRRDVLTTIHLASRGLRSSRAARPPRPATTS